MSEVPNNEKPPPYSAYVPPQQGACPPPGYQPYVGPTAPLQGAYCPTYGATAITVQPQEIIIVGACPVCRVGFLEDDFTCLGILLAILFFPFGILCCLALKNRRCSNCGAYFG
ncbi:Hypothetical predicted protein [Cloeon dipterum]|uniref:Membrane protein BRI3 n=1 Tax=Cloeon dipterum TaxID=197152 RepID=A0A8S1D6T9_9INSE|nr:Hypothetical predicted protein [Cloeon dipterum]